MTFSVLAALTAAALAAAPAAQPAQRRPAGDDGKVRVVFEMGRLTVKRAKTRDHAIPVRLQARVGQGGIVRAGSRGAALIYIQGTRVRLLKGAAVRLRRLRLNRQAKRFIVELEVLSGKVLFKVSSLKPTGSHLTVRTPVCVLAVRGTAFVVDATAARRTRVDVLEGVVDSYPAAAVPEGGEPAPQLAPIPVRAGQEEVFADGQAAAEPAAIPAAERAEEQRLLEETEQAPAEETAAEEAPEEPGSRVEPEPHAQPEPQASEPVPAETTPEQASPAEPQENEEPPGEGPEVIEP